MRKAIWVAVGVLTALASPTRAQDRPGEVSRQDFTPSVREAVDKGLDWLAARQNPNGSWTNRVGYKLYEEYFGEENDSVDVTAISCMALVSAGHVPGRGKYGKNVSRTKKGVRSKVKTHEAYAPLEF